MTLLFLQQIVRKNKKQYQMYRLRIIWTEKKKPNNLVLKISDSLTKMIIKKTLIFSNLLISEEALGNTQTLENLLEWAICPFTRNQLILKQIKGEVGLFRKISWSSIVRWMQQTFSFSSRVRNPFRAVVRIRLRIITLQSIQLKRRWNLCV